MSLRSILAVASLATVASGLQAQTFHRQAALIGGERDRGRCSMEIVVDGAAEVAIRADDATVTNLNGQPPQVRRFECTTALPPNPVEFQFRGIDGRGRQTLLRPAGNGQPAVVRIEDHDNGSDRYVFEITWRGGFRDGRGPLTDGGRFNDGRSRRFTTDQAVNVCQDSVRTQTMERYRTNDVHFRDTRLDDAPGRNDWVIGTLEARQPGRPDLILKFSCSVNFDTGVVRSAQVDPFYSEGGRPGLNQDAVRSCKGAVEDKVRHDGFDRVTFGNISLDDRPGRTDWIMGDFEAVGRYGPESLHFACAVDARTLEVRSIDVTTVRR